MIRLGRRPEPWYGPDDYDEGDDIDAEMAKRDRAIAEWDASYERLTFWQKLRHNFRSH